jgi:hypothetical protein
VRVNWGRKWGQYIFNSQSAELTDQQGWQIKYILSPITPPITADTSVNICCAADKGVARVNGLRLTAWHVTQHHMTLPQRAIVSDRAEMGTDLILSRPTVFGVNGASP